MKYELLGNVVFSNIYIYYTRNIRIELANTLKNIIREKTTRKLENIFYISRAPQILSIVYDVDREI